jgi:hypothetical protein
VEVLDAGAGFQNLEIALSVGLNLVLMKAALTMYFEIMAVAV